MKRARKNFAGMENLLRAQSKLSKHQAALDWLRTVKGLTAATIEKFHLGLSEPIRLGTGSWCSNALAAPVIGSDGLPRRRRCHLNIPDITVNPKNEKVWTAGEPLVYYSGNSASKKRLLVVSDIFDVWRLAQETDGNEFFADWLFVTGTHDAIVADEFRSEDFWARFEEIYITRIGSGDDCRAVENLNNFCPANAKRVSLPRDATTWTDFFAHGKTAADLADRLARGVVAVMSAAPEEDTPAHSELGEFPIEPINCNGAYVNGYLYYPYQVEKREIERVTNRDGTVIESLVTSYHTKVIRSDGSVLDIEYLPAPRGTPRAECVLALSDGTRIEQLPRPNHYATWHLSSITEFIRRSRSRQRVADRSLPELLHDLENHYSRAVWLPYEEDYAVLALYTALSYVYNVFEAIPLLLLRGEKGTGKTDLGSAVEAVGFNAKIIGQSSAASAVRVIHESRGLIVWDDLEAIAVKPGADAFTDTHQMLKLSYKKKTSKKALTNRAGHTTVFDFYGPKVINNTRGVDPILGSRMVTVRTRRLPAEISGKWDLSGSDSDFTFRLRNDLHIWGMDAVRRLDELYRQTVAARRGNRRDEILLPLRVIAEFSADPRIGERLERAVAREDAAPAAPPDPDETLRRALDEIVADGYRSEVALPHLQLQIAALLGGGDLFTAGDDNEQPTRFWEQPLWIGNAVEIYRDRRERVRVRRARLYGKETRIYKLSPETLRRSLGKSENGGENAARKIRQPFDFCLPKLCRDCCFANLCEATVPWLMPAKKRRAR